MGNTSDALLAPTARGQHGAFTYRQARDAEFSSSAIHRRVASGRWVAPHRGVFYDSAVPASIQRDASAAVLACGERAAASHLLAAQLWQVDTPSHQEPDITVLGRSRPPGIRIHETTRLTPAEAAPLDGIRVTSPMRTLLDLAEMIEPRLLELALDRFWRRRLIHPLRLLEYLRDPWCMNARGTAALRKLVAERCGQRPSGADVETMLFQLIREHRMPLPVRQHPVVTPFGVRYLDLAYVAPKIAIETDGMEVRLDPDVFLDERVRQNLIEAQGWTFRRFGYAHVTDHAVWTIFTLGEALGLHPTRWTRR